jgi:diguanylate cyclase (GGDEF)-like protein
MIKNVFRIKKLDTIYLDAYKKSELYKNSIRLMNMQLGVSIFCAVFLLLEVSGIVPYVLPVILLQSLAIIICMSLYFWIRYLLPKEKLKMLNLAHFIMHAISIFFACILTVSLSILLGHPSYSGYFIGIFILSFTFQNKPQFAIVAFFSSYIALSIYFFWTYSGIALVAEMVNSMMLVLLLCISVIIRHNGNVKIFLQDISIKEANQQLYHQSNTDLLTGLYNRRKVLDDLALEINKANRYDLPLSVVIIDIDYFKSVNDTYGHNVGDSVLKEFSNYFKSHLRDTDMLGRWGGEEFIIVCTNTDSRSAFTFIDRLRINIEKHSFDPVDHIAFSAGISQYSKSDQIDDTIDRADKALYLAKSSGRNRVKISDI